MTQEIVLAVLGGSVGAALVTGIFQLIQWRLNNKKKESGELWDIKTGVRMLLYNDIKIHAKMYLADGKISTESLEDIIEMHKIYHDSLNGNGFLDSLMRQVKALPIEDS